MRMTLFVFQWACKKTQNSSLSDMKNKLSDMKTEPSELKKVEAGS